MLMGNIKGREKTVKDPESGLPIPRNPKRITRTPEASRWRVGEGVDWTILDRPMGRSGRASGSASRTRLVGKFARGETKRETRTQERR